VQRDFAESEGDADADAVVARLASLDLPLAAGDTAERVQAALVLLAGGSWKRFEAAVAQAETDWRDTLVAAGLADGDWPARVEAFLAG
jgi:hypothetical protein